MLYPARWKHSKSYLNIRISSTWINYFFLRKRTHLRSYLRTYQRSFVDYTEQPPVSTDQTNDEFEANSTANIEKRTSAARLVEQLISK